jgi:hypothetical protein
MKMRYWVCFAALFALVTQATVASAAVEKFFGNLDGLQENPDVLTGATGLGTATYDSTLNTLAVTLSFSGLGSNANNAHIHCCSTSAATNAGVAIDFPSVGFPLGVTSGSFSHTFDLGLTGTYNTTYFNGSGGTAAMARDRLLNSMRGLTGGNLGVAYFNIHSVNNGPGEIRGNISPVPEPAAVVSMAMGLASLGLRRRFRK